MALIPPFFLVAVIAIGRRDDKGDASYTATGFLYGKVTGETAASEHKQYRVYLVTNRHVVEGVWAAVLRFHPGGAVSAKVCDAPFVALAGNPLYSLHPDATVDVAAMPINIGLLKSQGIQISFFQNDYHVKTMAQAKDAGTSEGDGVFVLGFPLGDPGADRNYVVVRHGILARVRDALAGGNRTFLVDASIFPGNSGGPVITRPEIVSIAGTVASNRADLIGIVSAYVPYRDVAISAPTKQARIIFEENSGLGVVVPVDRIAEVVDVAQAKIVGPTAPPPAPAPTGN